MAVDINLIRESYLFVLAPVFLTSDVGKLSIINSHITFASEDVNADVFEEKTNRAIALLTAFNLVNTNPLNLVFDSSILGNVSKARKKIDNIESEFGYSNTTNATSKDLLTGNFSSNKFGIAYLQLLESCKIFSGFII